MIKCVCGCDPEVCYCEAQQFHIPPPESGNEPEWDDWEPDNESEADDE